MFYLFPILLITSLLVVNAQYHPTDTGRNCESGYFDNGNYCERCPPRSTSKYDSFFCTPCAEGLYAVEPSDDYGGGIIPDTCSECPAGYIINGTRCQPCPHGSYSEKIGSTQCIACPDGGLTTFRGTDSADGCFTCSKGSYIFSDAGGGSCEPCLDGEYQDETNQLKCKPCPRGTSHNGFAEESIDKCVPCLSGTYSEEEVQYGRGRQCIPCPVGFYYPTLGASRCLKCPNGTRSIAGRTACAPLSNNSTSLSVCPPGSGRKSTQKKCTPCPSGTASVRNSVTECVVCRGDLIPSPQGRSCMCPKNLVIRQDDPGSCTKCPPGIKVSGRKDCACPNGKFFFSRYSTSACRCKPFTKENGSGLCVPCTENDLRGRDAQYDCNLCEAGYVFDSKKERCVRCANGYFSELGDKTCRRCPLTYVDKTGRTRCNCRPGTVLRKGECRPCPRGTYSGKAGERCASCRPGFFSNKPGQTRCEICPKRQRYSSSYGDKNCPPLCPSDARVTKNACVCNKQPILEEQGSKNRCVWCPAGTWISFTRNCEECESGLIPRKDQSGCMFCPEGTFSIKRRSTKCLRCPEGTYHKLSGGCGRCRPGFRVRNGKCVACIDSVNTGGDLSYCVPCENGTMPSSDKSTCV